ncbi:MAG TPA: flagellar motor protein MotB, partial [Anaerohalosphaeraceae bacterium]|nr:flagellar motor protein MotB [Anaerohalosphaeraceae bacterium]
MPCHLGREHQCPESDGTADGEFRPDSERAGTGGSKHAEHHGGSWKVAYADFVTAMMAFFLLLWLLAMVSPEKRIALSQYFKEFSVFKEQGEKVTQGGLGIFDQKGVGSVHGIAPGRMSELTPEKLKARIRTAVDTKLQAMKDQVLVDIREG